MADERPATTEEVIAAIAKANGVAAPLALAVARRESNFDQKAISQKGAIGIMQLMPGTAQELGVDPNDLVGNITGGVKYLKQMSDRYNGDVTKALQAYNAGPGVVDGGQISPEVEAYATSILSDMARSASAQSSGVTPKTAPIQPVPSHEPKSLLREMAEGFDPRRREGRQNIAGAVGGMGGAILGAPTVAVAGPAGPATTGLLGAMAMAGLVEGGEQFIDWLQGEKSPDVAEVGKVTGTQGLYEAGGHLVIWPFARVGRSLIASRVGRNASEALGRGVETARATGREFIDTARDTAREALESTRVAGREFIDRTRTGLDRTVQAARQTAETASQTARRASAERLADADLHAAELARWAEVPYQQALERPPSREVLTQRAQEAAAGLPGLQGRTPGPIKRALDAAGKQIDEVAEQGPDVDLQAVQQALNDMAEKARPPSLFASKDKPKGIGFISNVASNPAQLAALVRGNSKTAGDPKLAAIIAEQLGLQESHPLPAILGQLQSGPPTLSFKEAHQLKRLLDEAVNWDRNAKKHLEGLTKGIRVKLREALGVFEPYNEATAAYSDMARLSRTGAGKELVSAAAQRPDRLAGLLKSGNPEDALALRRLLLEQSAAGGDAKLGQEAWDAVRATYTYDKVLAGGIDGLEDRVTKLLTQSPEFVKVVYGDESGKQVLQNYGRIGAAYRIAVERGGEDVLAAKTAGKAGVEAAETQGARDVEGAVTGARDTLRQTRRTVGESVRQRRIAGEQDVQAARDTAKAGVKTATAAQDAFKHSSMANYSTRPLQSQLADILRGTMLGPKTIWGAVSLMRLLQSPKGAELVQTAAHSGPLTQGIVRILTGAETGTAAASTIRMLMSMRPEDEGTPTKGGPITTTPQQQEAR